MRGILSITSIQQAPVMKKLNGKVKRAKWECVNKNGRLLFPPSRTN